MSLRPVRLPSAVEARHNAVVAELDEVVTALMASVMGSFERDAAGLGGSLGVGVLVWGDDGTLDEQLSVTRGVGADVVGALAAVPAAAHHVARRERRLVRQEPDGEVRAALDRAGLPQVRGMAALATEWGHDGDCVLAAWTAGEPGEEHADLLARWEPLVVSSAVTAVTCRGAAEQVGELLGVLRARIVIEQAKGMVMVQHQLPAEEAFELLRSVSQHSNTPVRAIARAVVAAGSGEDAPGDGPGAAAQDGLPARIAAGLLDPGIDLRRLS